MARRKREQAATSSPADARDRLAQMQAVAERFAAWRPAPEVLTRVRAVPTRFVQVDFATRVGGWPIERIATVHGPSNHGKTEFLHGLGLSFLEQSHFYGFVDAEYTTPSPWLGELMGRYAQHPGFVALRPSSFEQTVDAVREFVELIAEAREKGNLDPATTALLGIDSIRKLVPDRLLEKIAKEGAQGKRGSVDGMGGRAAMYKAALQSQWLDELVPLLASTHTALVIVTREADDPLADANDMKYDMAWRVQGSKSLIYDASLVVRITRDSWIRVGDGPSASIVGERHRARIWKTKIGGKDDKHADAFFHTGNGAEGFVGFDRARDVLELAKELGIIESAGAWLKFERHRWQGEAKCLAELRQGLVDDVEAAVRDSFSRAQSEADRKSSTGADVEEEIAGAEEPDPPGEADNTVEG
jgi:RecA/RadA recombinase